MRMMNFECYIQHYCTMPVINCIDFIYSQKGIQGKDITPYLLSRISELTGGESLKLNQQLIERNALIGSQIAGEFCRIDRTNREHTSLDEASKAENISRPSSSSSSKKENDFKSKDTSTGEPICSVDLKEKPPGASQPTTSIPVRNINSS